MVTMRTRDIAERVGGTVVGDADLNISAITSIDQPQPSAIAYVNEASQLAGLEDSLIACFLAPPGALSRTKTLILVKHPKIAWTRLLPLFHPPRTYPAQVSDKAYVSPFAILGDKVTVEPFAYIGDRAVIGNKTIVRAHAYVDCDVRIGSESVIHPHVTLYDHCVIGNRVVIHAGTVIGSDGFGYVFTGEEHVKVPQVGNVVIEDGVEIGSNVSIDRATIGSTVIKKGAKIDNLVQIAHNVVVGAHTVASSQVGISGSSKIGDFVTLAGQVGIADHCEVGDGAILGAQAGLPSKKKIPPRKIFFGSPARPYEVERKLLAAQPFLADVVKAVRDLAKRLKELEESSRSNPV
jgi:UDP-3-O-[3-hydroxymyristoyl] glucosamine N-acyltransferase